MMYPTLSVPRLLMLAFIVLAVVALFGCSRNPRDAESKYLERGRALLSAKDYARATLEFRSAVQAVPGDPEAHYQLGLAYIGSGATNEAAASFTRATQLNPGHVGAQVKLAEIMVRRPDMNSVIEAQKRANEVLLLSSDNVDAMNVVAVAEFRLGRSEDAEEQLRAALNRFPRSLSASVTLASMNLARQDLHGAEDVLKAAIEKAPESVDAVVALGQLYLLLGQWADAEAQFKSARSLDNKSAVALLGLATADLRNGRKNEAEEKYRQLAEMPDKSFRHLHASYLLQERRYDDAVKEFEKLAKEDPKDKAARGRLLEAYLRADRVADAENSVAAMLKTNPKDVDALYRQTLIQLAARKDKEAEDTLNRLLHLQPRSAPAHYLVAKIRRGHGDALRYRAELTEALRLNPAFLPARLELAQALTAANSSKAALEVVNSTPETQKNAVAVIAARAIVQLSMGDKEEARKTVDQGLALMRTPDLLMQDAVLKLMQKDALGARKSALETLRRDPEDLRALRMLAVTYVAQQKPDEAFTTLQEYSAQHRKSAVIQQFVGEWLVQNGKPQQAKVAFRAAKAADPNFYAADLALSTLHATEGNVATARALLLDVLKQNPANVSARLLLGNLETKAQNYPAAIEQYRKALESNPNNVLALNNVAYLLAESGQTDASLQYAQRARELDPGNADVAGTLGWALYGKGLYETAVRNLEEAVRRDGQVPTENAAIRKYHLAMAYAKSGDLQRAQDTLDAAMKVNGKMPQASAAQQAIADAIRPPNRAGQ